MLDFENPPQEMIPVAPLSDIEKSRPPTGIFLYPYLVIGNCLFLEQMVKGVPVKKKLCNFIAWITVEIFQDDGINSESLVRIEGIHASGRKLPALTVPLKKLNYLEWVQSFHPDDPVTPEMAHEIALKLAEQIPGFEIVVATHTDRDHIHSHFVINSVSCETGLKYHSNKDSLMQLWHRTSCVCSTVFLL